MEHRRILELRTLLDSRAWHPLRRALAEQHPADLAELLEMLSRDEEAIVLRLLGRRQGETFAYLGPGPSGASCVTPSPPSWPASSGPCRRTTAPTSWASCRRRSLTPCSDGSRPPP